MLNNHPDEESEEMPGMPDALKAILGGFKKFMEEQKDSDGLCDCDIKELARKEKMTRKIACKLLVRTDKIDTTYPEQLIQKCSRLAEEFVAESDARAAKLFPEKYAEFAEHLSEVTAKRAAVKEAKKAANSEPKSAE